jgi:hypothetical protein
MFELLKSVFGPLDKNGCVYFFFIMIFFFVMFIILLLGELYFIVRNYKYITFNTLYQGGYSYLFNIFLIYLTNRILFTMCTKIYST